MPSTVPDFIPVVGRYRTIATWRLSFHCGMNAADTSAWQGASSLRVTSSRVRCGPLVLLPLQMRETLGAHHRDMAPFIPLWNECRRHLGLAGRLQPSRHVESIGMPPVCSPAT